MDKLKFAMKYLVLLPLIIKALRKLLEGALMLALHLSPENKKDDKIIQDIDDFLKKLDELLEKLL